MKVNATLTKSAGKKLNSNQLVILHLISKKPSTVYSLGGGEAALVTGCSNMAIHKTCAMLESLGLIESDEPEQARGAIKKIRKVITKAGKEKLKELYLEPVGDVPRSLADLYVLEYVKNSSLVIEQAISDITKAKRKCDSKFVKVWLNDCIDRLSHL